MALNDGNTHKISGTDIEVKNIFITCIQPIIYVKEPQIIEIKCTYQCYESIDKWIENDMDNTLKIHGLVKRNFKLTYNRFEEEDDIFQFIDKGTKADLIKAFPFNDPNLITYIPPHEST